MRRAFVSWRVVLPLVGVGLLLLLGSVVLVVRDVAFARAEAEAEVLAFAETSALGIQFASLAETQGFLQRLLKHPGVAVATVYSGGTPTQTRRRASTQTSTLLARITRGLDEPVTACRAFGSRTLCLEADAGYYRERARALLVPHLVLLGASGCLLLAAMLLARGSSEKELRELTRIVDSAATEGNYALRASEAERSTAALARAVNQLLDEIQQRDLTLRRRTTELETVNRELEAFSYSVSHDLRSPLASIDGFSAALADFCGDQLDDSGKEYVQWIRDSVQQMNNLVAGLLQMSRVSRAELTRSPVDLSAIAQSLAGALQQRDPSRAVAFEIEPNLNVDGDERLLHAVLENLMSNAFKFTRKRDDAVIAVGSTVEGGRRAYFVRDNGAGFDTTGAARLFTPFQRLHSVSEFEGTGIGLATVRRIVERHGGTIWAEGKPGHGATFSFTLGDPRAGSGQADRDEAREGAVTT